MGASTVSFFARLAGVYLTKTAAKRGGFKRGGFPIWTCPSFFVLFCPVWDFPDFSGIFPICSGMDRGFSRCCPFPLSLGLFRVLRGTVPKGSTTQSGPFPKKVGNPPVWETPGLASLNKENTALMVCTCPPKAGGSKVTSTVLKHRNLAKF